MRIICFFQYKYIKYDFQVLTQVLIPVQCETYCTKPVPVPVPVPTSVNKTLPQDQNWYRNWDQYNRKQWSPRPCVMWNVLHYIIQPIFSGHSPGVPETDSVNTPLGRTSQEQPHKKEGPPLPGRILRWPTSTSPLPSGQEKQEWRHVSECQWEVVSFPNIFIMTLSFIIIKRTISISNRLPCSTHS